MAEMMVDCLAKKKADLRALNTVEKTVENEAATMVGSKVLNKVVERVD